MDASSSLRTDARTANSAARSDACACSTPTGARVERTAEGDGPVDAAFKAIEAATGVQRDAAQIRSARRVRRRGRAGRSSGVRRVQSAHLPWLERQHQHRRVEHRAFLEVINRIELSQAGSRLREERTGAARVAQASV